MQDLVYNKQRISVNDEMLCLTDMWRAAGSPENKEPKNWARFSGKEYIDFVKENLKGGGAPLWKTGRGRFGGGTWAHWQIGFAYAKYLSPEFHAWCNEVVRDHIMGLAGRSVIRSKGKRVRRLFTFKLTDHEVPHPRGFQDVTNSTYRVLLGGTASEIREQRQLPQGANLRDHMTPVELGATMFSEILATDRIADMHLRGVEQCSEAAQHCAGLVKTVVVDERASRKCITRSA